MDNYAYNLAFPFHKEASSLDRLESIKEFMDEGGLGAEYFLDGRATLLLERKVAEIFGIPEALWCPTGTMAQAITARIHAERRDNNQILFHSSSHVLLHEEEGYKFAHGLSAKIIGQPHKVIGADDLSKDAACAFIELPQRHNGGLLPSWASLHATKERACELGLPLHLDGARIWSCREYYGARTYAEIVDGFTSVYVSLYKDIGALGGAVLLGDEKFIAAAKVWRTRLGGLAATAWPYVCDALRLLDLRIDQMPSFVGRAREFSEILSSAKRIQAVPNPPHVNMLHIQLPCSQEQAKQVRNEVADETGVWLGDRFWPYSDTQCSLEITIGENAMEIPIVRISSALRMLDEKIQNLLEG